MRNLQSVGNFGRGSRNRNKTARTGTDSNKKKMYFSVGRPNDRQEGFSFSMRGLVLQFVYFSRVNCRKCCTKSSNRYFQSAGRFSREREKRRVERRSLKRRESAFLHLTCSLRKLFYLWGGSFFNIFCPQHFKVTTAFFFFCLL